MNRNNNSIKIDWFEFTIRTNDLYEALDFLGLSPSDFSPRSGRNGYTHGLTYNYNQDFIVLYSGNGQYSDSMGVHFVFSGSAIPTFFELVCHCNDSAQMKLNFDDKMHRFAVWFNDLYIQKLIKVSRVDIAFDDYEFYAAQDVLSLWNCGKISSHFKSSEIRQKEDNKICTGFTAYFGSRKSNVFLRVYDKRLEQNCLDLDRWTRFEFQLKDDKALAFLSKGLKEYQFDFDNYCRGLFYKFFEIKDDLFSDFLENASCIKIGRPTKKQKTMESVVLWLLHTAGPSIRTVIELSDGNEQLLSDLAHSPRRSDHMALSQTIE